jgi:hypothetical protein
MSGARQGLPCRSDAARKTVQRLLRRIA